MEWIRMFYKDDSGESSVEYCILVACIAVIIVTAVNIFGSVVKGLYTKCNDKWP
jgi:Flp pilus assembly pilin Flp